MASLLASSDTCEYKSKVVLTFAWPNISLTIFAGIPASNALVAKVCRGKSKRLDFPLYPNINKIQIFPSKGDKFTTTEWSGLDFILINYRLMGLTPEKPESPPPLFFHFLDIFLSSSSSRVASAFASCSVDISR